MAQLLLTDTHLPWEVLQGEDNLFPKLGVHYLKDMVPLEVPLMQMDMVGILDLDILRVPLLGDILVPLLEDIQVPKSGDIQVPMSGGIQVPMSGDMQDPSILQVIQKKLVGILEQVPLLVAAWDSLLLHCCSS